MAGATRVIVTGGTSAVTQATEDAIEGRLGIQVERLWGAGRYDTAKAVAEWELREGMGVSHVAVATGQNFPDALAGAALCGANGSVLVLARGTSSPTLSVISANASSVESAYVLGGSSAVSDSLLEHLRGITS